MIALGRYHLSLLLRSHRWIPAAVIYVIGVVGLGGSAPGQPSALPPALSWCALMLVPVVAWLSRSMLTAEPPAARSVVAAAAGARRCQLAALAATLGAGAVLGLVGVVWALLRCGPVRSAHGVLIGTTVADLGRGLGAALICLLVGSAIGALCNPPVLRRPAASMLTSTAAVVLALIWSISPANAAVRSGYGDTRSGWPDGVPVLAALVLLVAAWSISSLIAARRSA